MKKDGRPERNGSMRRTPRSEWPVLITGGAGFIGTNLAQRYLSQGERVTIFDNLSRPGVEQNLNWLRSRYGTRLRIEIGDVRDRMAVQRVVQGSRQVFHFAAQVAVTTSMQDPLADFEVNARGTLNVLGALASLDQPPSLVFTSTNKVYGALEDVRLEGTDTRYQPVEQPVCARGISEARPLDFHSPYGCSKGAADQYVIDYARTFGVPATVFRMSCIYGPHQYGNEDQGWVAHFLIRALLDEPVTVFGDGRQVRDLLFIDDLVAALLLAQQHMTALSGKAFNIGGGPANALSVNEVLTQIGHLTGREPARLAGAWRTGDQRYYVSDSSRFRELTGWVPRVSVTEGLARLHRWLVEEAGMNAGLRLQSAASPAGLTAAAGGS